MAEDLLYKLRADNALLINELRDGVSRLHFFIAPEKEKGSSELVIEKPEKLTKSCAMSKLDVRTLSNIVGSNRVICDIKDKKKTLPVNVRCRRNRPKLQDKHGARGKALTSTPIVAKTMLESEGNLRQKSTSTMGKVPRNGANSRLKPQDLEHNLKPKSILVMPEKRKTPKCGRPKVFFPSNYIDTKHYSEDSHRTSADKSLLGYDWIAGILDNENSGNVNDSDRLIEEINEFRRVNRDECSRKRTAYEPSPLENSIFAAKAADVDEIMNEDNDAEFCSGSTYTVDSRLLPVPIHGPYSQCPVCSTKPAPESEYSESYIRVSVPLSSLKSPYRLKPHRRKSFDPSDSVALSEHCLAGWQCARPSYAHGPDTVDIRSNINGVKKFPTTVANDVKTSYNGNKDEALSTAVGMSYGLKLLEDTENLQRKANTVKYSALS